LKDHYKISKLIKSYYNIENSIRLALSFAANRNEGQYGYNAFIDFDVAPKSVDICENKAYNEVV